MKYFSMFSGIGGFEHGIERAYNSLRDKSKRTEQKQEREYVEGNEIHPESINRPACVGCSEINKYAKSIYNYHYPGHKNYGNAKDIIPEEIPDFDLLVGGFPCQAFSIAGKRGGFDDTRGTLFFDVARVLKAKRPDWFLLENVKGLCSHDSGKTLGTIYKVLTDLDYTVGWEVVNSCQFGVPQNRERIFIVGHLTEAGGRVGEVLPVAESKKTNNAKNLQQSNGSVAGTLNTKNNSGQLSVDKGTVLISDSGNGHKFEEQEGVVPTLRKGTASGYHNYLKVGTWRTHKDGRGFREVESGLAPTIPARAREDGSGQPVIKAVITPNRLEKRQNGRRFKDNEEPSFTLTSQDKHGVQVGTEIRRLTPVECERLQGFPDGWTEKGMMDKEVVEISDTQRYKALGNAVTVNVIEAIMVKIFKNYA